MRQWFIARIALVASAMLAAQILAGATGGPTSSAAAAVTAGSRPGLSQTTAYDTGCVDIVVVGARGSGEGPNSGIHEGLGGPVSEAVDYYAAALPNYRIAWYAVPYPALPAPSQVDGTWVNRIYDVIAGFLFNDYGRRTSFYESIDTGVSLTETFLVKRASQCPHERYVLAGYSQGAMVMHRVLNRLALNMTSPNSFTSILQRVDGGLAIADGDRIGAGKSGKSKCYNAILGKYTSQGGSSYGTASTCAIGVSAATRGTDGTTYLPQAIAIPDSATWSATRWRDICLTDDLICATNLSQLGAGGDIHGNAYTTAGTGIYAGIGVPYVKMAVADLVKQSKKVKPAPLVSITVPSSGSVTYGSPYTAQATATGGTAPYTWSSFVSADGTNDYCALGVGALAGVWVDSKTGAINGTPTCDGTTTVGVEVTDAYGTWASKTYTVTVTGAPPVGPPAPLGNISSIVANASDTAYAIRGDGTVWAWGQNATGQLGTGNTATSTSLPAQVRGLSGVTRLAVTGYASEGTAFALKNDGTVWAWGANEVGQLGNGNTTNSSTPIQVSGLSGIVDISVGTLATEFYAVRNDGTVWTLAVNSGFSGNTATTPYALPGLSGIHRVIACNGSDFAINNSGDVWAWGNNQNGQLGIGTFDYSFSPTPVSGLGAVSDITCTWESTFALRNDGTAWAWGDNTAGQLGIGGNANSPIPVMITGLSSVRQLSANGFGSEVVDAIKSDGTAWAWGDNSLGLLGDGTNTNSSTPVKIGLDAITTVASTRWDTYALRSDGSVWGWGSGGINLWDYSRPASPTPVQMPGMSGITITNISSGGNNGYAIASDSTAWAWCRNDLGQLGDGKDNSVVYSLPQQVVGQ